MGRYVEAIPHAVLAGILMKMGWDIIDWRLITRAHRVQREHLIVMVITMGLTVFLDLVTAVAIGLIAAGMAGARAFERLEMDSVISVPLLDHTFLGSQGPDDDRDIFSARVGMVSLRGSFSVASSNRLINAISAAFVVEQLNDAAMDENTECIVMGLEGRPAITLRALNVLRRVPEDRFVGDLDGARQIAIRILGEA